MMSKFSDNFVKAAKASGMSPEKFADCIRGLLSPSRCRDTSGRNRSRLFNLHIMSEISHA